MLKVASKALFRQGTRVIEAGKKPQTTKATKFTKGSGSQFTSVAFVIKTNNL